MQLLLTAFRSLDRILRGEATRPSAVRHGMIDIPGGGLTIAVVILGMTYGLFMGFYALFREGGPHFVQMLASMVKVPLLFLLTLAVTFPSLYVFNALVGSRYSALSVFRLLLATLAVMMAVLASFGPIAAFFSVSTTSYAFVTLLNVLLFSIAGGLGLKFLLLTMHRLSVAQDQMAATQAAREAGHELDAALGQGSATPEPTGALDPLPDRILGPSVKSVFQVWIVVFAIVGAQMGWVLRPFIGTPEREFAWFRPRESSFVESLTKAAGNVLFGEGRKRYPYGDGPIEPPVTPPSTDPAANSQPEGGVQAGTDQKAPSSSKTKSGSKPSFKSTN